VSHLRVFQQLSFAHILFQNRKMTRDPTTRARIPSGSHVLGRAATPDQWQILRLCLYASGRCDLKLGAGFFPPLLSDPRSDIIQNQAQCHPYPPLPAIHCFCDCVCGMNMSSSPKNQALQSSQRAHRRSRPDRLHSNRPRFAPGGPQSYYGLIYRLQFERFLIAPS